MNVDGKLIKHTAKVKIGFGATQAMKDYKISDILQFKEECRTYFRELYFKLVEKLPFDNQIVKGA